MATLTPTITLTSADATSDALSITATTPLTVTTPSVGLSRQTITVSDDQELVDEAVAGMFYLDATNFVILQTTASVQFARLSPGEFCFFPINTGAGLEARADTASCILEYGYWKKG